MSDLPLPLPTTPPQHRWALGWCRCGEEFSTPEQGREHTDATGHTVCWEEHAVWCSTLAGPARRTKQLTFPSELPNDVVRTLPARESVS